MHDLALHVWWVAQSIADHHTSLTAAPSAPSGGGDSNTVKVAIVTAVGLVVATAITAIASTLKRSATAPAPGGGVSQNEVFTKQYIRSLEADRRELGKLRTSHAHLREACLDNNLDPDKMIREQEQP